MLPGLSVNTHRCTYILPAHIYVDRLGLMRICELLWAVSKTFLVLSLPFSMSAMLQNLLEGTTHNSQCTSYRNVEEDRNQSRQKMHPVWSLCSYKRQRWFFARMKWDFFLSLKNKKNQNNPKNKNTVLCTSSAEHESSCSLVLLLLYLYF